MIKAIFFDFYGVINVNGLPNQEIIEFLQSNNNRYLFAILSAAAIDLHDWLLQNDIADPFDLVQTTSQLNISKTEPAFYTKALEVLELKPEEALMIDDNPNYVELCKKLGMKAFLYNPKQNFLSQIEAYL